MVDAHPRAAILEVRRHQKRNEGTGLEAVQLRHVCVGNADGDGDPTEPFLDPPEQLAEVGVALGCVTARDPGDHKLCDSLT